MRSTGLTLSNLAPMNSPDGVIETNKPLFKTVITGVKTVEMKKRE